MEQLSYRNFIEQIAKDFNLSLYKEYKLNLPSNKDTIKSFVSSVANKVRIYDGNIEHPYMLTNCRNDEVLKRGIELRYLGMKKLKEITEEAGIELKSEKCKICEGGGWYSNGRKYFYKDYYIEV